MLVYYEKLKLSKYTQAQPPTFMRGGTARCMGGYCELRSAIQDTVNAGGHQVFCTGRCPRMR